MSDFEKVSKAILQSARHINEESARVKSMKTVVDQEFNHDSGVHRLVLSTIADGQIQAEVFGPWVPSRAVAAVGDYRAFHPRHMAEGLPRLFRIIDCG